MTNKNEKDNFFLFISGFFPIENAKKKNFG